ncbi:hypothetical protein KFE26_22265 [Shewanella sp. M16]|uniref:hypothetical protein n=1 Tax=Shewanella sp. M16 TaxID=2830837 RepID=UPI001BAF3079|nr:hypothetical protein [Shewanella sp. M16]MBS0044982.1 hypothetical protein [Shewanella sp. M16]
MTKDTRGLSGDVRTKTCVVVNGTLPKLEAELYTAIDDYRTGEKLTGSRKIEIPAGSYNRTSFCSEPENLGEIYNEGNVIYGWEITDSDTGKVYSNFETISTFDGAGSTNDWDLNEKGQCGVQGDYGVWMGFKGVSTCGKLENIDDEEYVTVYYAPDLSNVKPESSDTNTYRVNFGMLMASFDGLRYSDGLAGLQDLFTRPIGEIIRKADQIGQQSELVGKISVHLPDGTEKVLLDTHGEVLPVNFLETNLQSFTFSLPKSASTPQVISIECNVYEQDETRTADDAICSGTKDYILSNVNSLKIPPKSGDVGDTVAQLLNGLGYEKFTGIQGWGSLKEVVNNLLEYPPETWSLGYFIVHPVELNNILKGISGIYMIDANIEKLDNYSSEVTSTNVSWDFYNSGTKSPGTEAYGQFYYMPNAFASDVNGLVGLAMEGMTLSVLLDLLGIEIDEQIIEKISTFPIPFYRGQAIPLFNLNRKDALKSDYQAAEYSKFDLVASHIKSNSLSIEDSARGAYFINFWERDGESAIEVDDCLAKGNAFGLQNTLSGEIRFDDCNYSTEGVDDHYVNANLNATDTINEIDNEFIIEGELTFSTSDGAGGSFESFGHVTLNNDKKEFFSSSWDADSTAVKDGELQHIPFSSTFKSNGNPMINLFVEISESDTGEDDEIAKLNQTIVYEFGIEKTVILGNVTLTYKVSKAAQSKN